MNNLDYEQFNDMLRSLHYNSSLITLYRISVDNVIGRRLNAASTRYLTSSLLKVSSVKVMAIWSLPIASNDSVTIGLLLRGRLAMVKSMM